jgi:hypothetical protein
VGVGVAVVRGPRNDRDEVSMTASAERATNSVALIHHLARFPEDLRDIRRLQRRFRLSAAEVARALEDWAHQQEARDARELSH